MYYRLMIGNDTIEMKTHSRKTFNLILRLWDALLERFTTPGIKTEEGLSYWRSRVLQHLVAVTLLTGLAVLGPTVTMLLRSGFWLLALLDTLIYLVVITLMMIPMGYRIRVFIALAGFYAVGASITINLGVVSGGPFWLFAFAAIAGILIGFKSAVAAILINAVTLTLLGGLQADGVLASGQPFYPSIGRAGVAGVNFLFLNALVAFSIAGLTQGLQSVIIRARSARDELAKEIDARKRTERSLKASEEKYRLLAENLSDILWSLDMDLNITYISPAATTLLGWSAEELKAMGVSDVLTSGSTEKAVALIGELPGDVERGGDFGKAATLVLEMRCKDGSTLPVETRGAFLLGEDRRPIGIIGISRDISRRIRAQKENEALQSRLVQSKKMEAIGLLASGVAHDLNNVLSGIVSYPDLLLLDLPAESPLRKPLETIRQTGNKAADIVQDLLVMARRNVQSFNVTSLNRVVEEHLCSPEHSDLLLRYPGVEICTELDPQLANIKGSSIHLKKTLMNLLINGAEAQPQGGAIMIRTLNATFAQPPKGLPQMPPGTYVGLEVSDSGVGITEEDQQRIFEPFFTRKVMGRSGSGLGMSVVWGTVEDHNGFISVQSEEMQGTTFKLYFPATDDKPKDTQRRVSPERYLGNGETVLVVDDVADQREIAARILERLGYRAVTAASGEEALDYLKRIASPVDAVILDMIMPGLDGLDTYKAIRQLHPETKALIASGFSETGRVKEAIQLGVGAYVRKPYMLEDIGLAMRKILSSSIDRDDQAGDVGI